MPERMVKWLTGVARRHPETVRMALCSRVDQCQGGDFQGLGTAPHVVPARRRIRATRAVVFALRFSRCWRNESVRSCFTPREVGADWNCSLLPFTVMLISRLDGDEGARRR